MLTKTSSVEVVHIFPLCLLKENHFASTRRLQVLETLYNFWPKEKVREWFRAVFRSSRSEAGFEFIEIDKGKAGIETAKNLITLGRHIHDQWNKGEFALKPLDVSADEKTLRVQFFWQIEQKGIKRERGGQPQISLLELPHSTKDLDNYDGNFLVDCRSLGTYQEDGHFTRNSRRNPHIIKSGDIFELKTDDPQERPLPSFALLEMQWFLHRVRGMAGAAEPGDDWDWEVHRDQLGVPYSRILERLQTFGDDDSIDNWDSDDEISDPGFNRGEASFMSSHPNRSDSTEPERDVFSKDILPSVEKHQTEIEGEVEGEAKGEGDQVIEGH